MIVPHCLNCDTPYIQTLNITSNAKVFEARCKCTPCLYLKEVPDRKEKSCNHWEAPTCGCYPELEKCK